MKNIKNKIVIQFILTTAIILGSFTSCKKDFFDINTDPNHPADVKVEYILPSAEAAIAHAVGNDLMIYGGLWAQYWTQSPAANQYKNFEEYNPSSIDFDYPWGIFYSDALEDLKTIISKAGASGQTQYVACAKILEAYAFQVLTDNFGDIPFKEALQLDAGILSPHYNSQSDIYDGIITLLKDGIALVDENADASTPGTPGSADLLLGGNMYLWKEFGNTMLLKVYLRLSYVNAAKAQAGITQLVSSGAVFLGEGEEVQMNYGTEGGKTNPLYSSIVALGFIQNLVASGTCVNYMINNNDPRLDVFYTPASNGTQIGIPQGEFTLPPGTPVSTPSPVTGANANDATSATAPVKLMSSYESMFLQSEAIARGWLPGDPKDLYESGIAESFTTFGITADSATMAGYLSQAAIAYPVGGTVEDQVKAIITQKWVAMCGNQTDEAWIESRRTNYPDFFTISAGTIIGNFYPERFPYPTSEVTKNGNFPGQKNITDKVWWDVN